MSILTQLNMYITANAEKLRSHFVAHEGQEILSIQVDGTGKDFIASNRFGEFVEEMTNAMLVKIIDKDLRSWVLPDFSTIRESDKVVASITFMGAMSKYFKYRMEGTGCGLPSVTLFGEREDWVKTLEKLPKIESLGPEAEKFVELLTPVLNNFIKTFDKPNSESTKDFW